MLQITTCLDRKCSCHDEPPDTPETGAGIPPSRALTAVDDWIATVDLVLAGELPVAA